MDEKLLIRKILKGDTSAFGYFVDAYQSMAMIIAYRICANKQDAEDIVQESFVKAFHNLHTFRVDSKFSTWFYRIVYNTAITEIRTTIFNTEFIDYSQLEGDNLNLDWDVLATIDEQERANIVNRAMERLPKDESLILSLYYLEENAVKDIQMITGLSESNVKVRLHRGRKHLKEILDKMILQDAGLANVLRNVSQ